MSTLHFSWTSASSFKQLLDNITQSGRRRLECNILMISAHYRSPGFSVENIKLDKFTLNVLDGLGHLTSQSRLQKKVLEVMSEYTIYIYLFVFNCIHNNIHIDHQNCLNCSPNPQVFYPNGCHASTRPSPNLKSTSLA